MDIVVTDVIVQFPAARVDDDAAVAVRHQVAVGPEQGRDHRPDQHRPSVPAASRPDRDVPGTTGGPWGPGLLPRLCEARRRAPPAFGPRDEVLKAHVRNYAAVAGRIAGEAQS